MSQERGDLGEKGRGPLSTAVQLTGAGWVFLMLLGGYIVGCSSLSSATLAASQAEASNQSPGITETLTLPHDGVDREFVLHLPHPGPDEAPLPLVIALHGLTQQNQDFMHQTQFNSLADQKHFAVVYPQGLRVRLAEGRMSHWNSYHGTGVDDMGFIRSLVDYLVGQYGVDGRQVYVVGLSNGGELAFRLACEMPDLVTAFATVGMVMVAGQLLNCGPSAPVPYISFHGTEDSFVPYEGRPEAGIMSVQQTLDFWAAHMGCEARPVWTVLDDKVAEDGTRVSRLDYTHCRQNTAIVHYRIEGGGHTWPGRQSGHRATGILGKSSREINATALMWAFFARYELVQ